MSIDHVVSPYFFLPLLLFLLDITLNSGHLIFLSTTKKYISLFTMTNLTFLSPSLSTSLVLSLAIHLRQPLVPYHRHHHPQEPNLTKLRYMLLPSLLICYFSWLICYFLRIRVLGFSLGFLLILPNLIII